MTDKIEIYEKEEQFDKTIKKKGVIHFYAPWCFPCVNMDNFLLGLKLINY
jgi:hypothetical protein